MTEPKNKTPKSDQKNWKGSLSRLLSCGSGKKEPAEESLNAPLSRTENKSFGQDDLDGEVNHEVITTNATPGHGQSEDVEISYSDIKVIGKGTFGIVYRAKLCNSGDLVAIKKVFHDERFKNRELQMMRQLEHPNVLQLRYFFYSRGERYKSNELYLNMMLEYMPETLYSVAQCDGTKRIPLMDILYVKVYMYQLFRSLAYLHAVGICHRDIKPQNMLLDPQTHIIKLCDFGSAKELLKGEANIAYICSRYYRAPELVLGTTNYTCKIDVWSAGCVLGELLMGQPIFPGANGPDQLVEIIKVLGTPNSDDVFEINPNYMEFRFPQLLPHPWPRVFKDTHDLDILDLVAALLIYSPSKRIHPIEACAHHCFDQLRNPRTRLPDGKPLPPLFNFTNEELSINPDLNSRLIPTETMRGDDVDYMIQNTPLQTSRLESSKSTRGGSLLGNIGGSFRSSFKGIANKSPLALTSSKKKKKKQKGIEDTDDHGVPAVPSQLDFSHDQDVEQSEHVQMTGEENVENVDVHSKPVEEMMEKAVKVIHAGVREDSLPTGYRDYLNQPDDEGNIDLEQMPQKMSGLDINDQPSGKKKKKSTKSAKAKVPAAGSMTEDIERSIEASMMSSYMESDGISDVPPEAAPSSRPKPKKTRKPVASTPNEEEAKSFEESPTFTPPKSSRPRHSNRDSDEPLPDDEPMLEEPVEEVQVKIVKKKKPKVAKKPTKAQLEHGGNEERYSSTEELNDSRARRVHTDM